MSLFRATHAGSLILGLILGLLSHFAHVGRESSHVHKDGGQARLQPQTYPNNASFSERAISALQQCRLPEVLQSGVRLGYHTARIDSDNLIAFRHITKCGSSTLSSFAALMQSPEFIHHEQQFDGLRVAFVRDPVDRFVSSYMEIRRRGYTPHYDDIQQDFDEFFVRYLEGKYGNGRYTITKHFRAQTAFLTHRNGDGITFDYIGRTEHLKQEWNTSFRSFLPTRIPDLPEKIARATKKIKPVMSPDQIRHVCRLYCHDFCCLGIDFPQECTCGESETDTGKRNSTGCENLDVCPCHSMEPPLYPWDSSS